MPCVLLVAAIACVILPAAASFRPWEEGPVCKDHTDLTVYPGSNGALVLVSLVLLPSHIALTNQPSRTTHHAPRTTHHAPRRRAAHHRRAHYPRYRRRQTHPPLTPATSAQPVP